MLNLPATAVASTTQTCLSTFICANEIFISIYGVIFTIVISLGVYIYGLQNKTEKITLLKSTGIKRIITDCLSFFAISFFALPSPIYEFINFILAGGLIFNLYLAFSEVFKFNENELSGEREVKKFKEGVIFEKLKQFEDLRVRNNLLNSALEEKRGGKEIERFLLDENNDSYYFIRAQSSGYITNIDLSVLFTKEINQTSSKNFSYYIPYNISNGAPIEFDGIILGIKKEAGQQIDEKRLRSFVSISDEYENPSSYLEAETRSYYSEMFSLIKIEDAKSLDLKLREFSSFVDHFTNKPDSYIDIIQFINDDIIFPLQKYAFKLGDVDCIRKVVSFSLGYIYQSLDKKSIKTFNIFLRNFGHAFYESFHLESQARSDFLDIYFRWLKEIAKYSIKSRVLKDKDYIEYATNFLSNVNGWLKIAFDNKDIEIFTKTASFLSHSFSRESYERQGADLLAGVILNKKAVIFGFTAWVYKYYGQRKNEEFYKEALSQLFLSLQKDPAYNHVDIQDNLNYYLSVYKKATQLSESKGSFGWDSWGMPEGRVYTVTIRQDIKNLLADRILKIVSDNPEIAIDIREGNYDDDLSYIKKGDKQFDPLVDKDKSFFIATSNLSEAQFEAAKLKFYAVFSQITLKYKKDVRVKLIEQPLDDLKFNEFARVNFESYKKSRLMSRIQKFNRQTDKKKGGFGYNILLRKEQFVADTNVHYTNDDQFGEDLARSEDNKVLEEIYKKISKISSIRKDEVGQITSTGNDLVAIVLWVNEYLNIEDTNPKDFKPYWHESDSKKENGPHYQGSIGSVPVYIVYKFHEHKAYPDTIFSFKEGAFLVNEFEIEWNENPDKVNTKWKEDATDCLSLSIRDLSSLEDERTKIVEKWIKDDSKSVEDKQDRIEELKTEVVFKFFKGLSADDLVVDDTKVAIHHIK